MATIYKRKGSKYWWIHYRFGGKTYRKSTYTEDKELAKQILDATQGDIARGKYDLLNTKPTITFSKLAEEYIKYAKVNKKSWKTDVGRLKKIIPVFGKMRLSDISPFHIEMYKQKLMEDVTPATVNRHLALLKHMFNLAIKWQKAKHNPVNQVRFFKEKNQRLRYLEEEEIPLLIKNCCTQLKPLVTTAVYTGMRRGELFRLKWKDVDFKHNLIYIENTKSGEPREVPMNEEVKKVLLNLKANSSNKFVFLNKYGRPFKDIRTAFHTALRRTGIKCFRFHDLRHTFGSHLAMAGIPLLTIKELMGHKDVKMTMRYAHLSRKHKEAAVETFLRRVKASENIHIFNTVTKKEDKTEVSKS